ncbi:MAG: uncharacterized protein KVP18_005102 [Porospora cf. gigantea A]|uniref:uncharacterized protein n=1 Tax=Porospora cf. gigantea A TaxID=2853593 RepID=UPI0035599C59|nr:MAG: hypothetical protein KVP18_005102 [Porospora cf. gigantea A]
MEIGKTHADFIIATCAIRSWAQVPGLLFQMYAYMNTTPTGCDNYITGVVDVSQILSTVLCVLNAINTCKWFLLWTSRFVTDEEIVHVIGSSISLILASFVQMSLILLELLWVILFPHCVIIHFEISVLCRWLSLACVVSNAVILILLVISLLVSARKQFTRGKG